MIQNSLKFYEEKTRKSSDLFKKSKKSHTQENIENLADKYN